MKLRLLCAKYGVGSLSVARHGGSPRRRWAVEALEDRRLLAATTWQLNSAESFVTLTIPDQDVDFNGLSVNLQIRNQTGSTSNPWSTNTSQMAGQLETDYTDGASIQFLLGASTLTAQNSGNYRPDVAAFNPLADPPEFTNTSAAAGDFGGRIRGLAQTLGYFSISGVTYDAFSAAVPIAGTSFAADAVTFGATAGTLAIDGQEAFLIGQVIPDTLISLDSLLAGVNESTAGSIISLGGQDRELTLPISFDVLIEAGPDTPALTGTVSGQIVATTTLPTPSTVAGRHIFYNQSAFDGNNAAQGTADDAAIATDKSAYIPNATTAVFNNITSFTRGINGIMVDLVGGGDHASINANDFIFKVGNNNSPSTWATVTATPTISVRTGAGTGGSDRVTITWASASIRNQWLEVQVLPTANTGLTAADVFFWGNKVGDTGQGTPATTFLTSGADKTSVLGLLGGSVGVTSIRDFNRDNSVTAADATVVTGSLGSITRLNVGAGGPFAPEGDGGDSGVASALAASSTSASAAALPAGVARRLENVDLNSGRIAAFFQHLADQNTPGTRKLLVKIDAVADELGLDHELLDSLLSDLGLE